MNNIIALINGLAIFKDCLIIFLSGKSLKVMGTGSVRFLLLCKGRLCISIS
ncbi:hypothetical protein [Methanobrevibacter oralis]|uniref:hypothetical protein n=1 Tax=Methanobrevibacter oralis TaxID=66851 RepID=UPI00164D6A30|nr:hypothetical protein [Methanobrevibacter oralis]